MQTSGLVLIPQAISGAPVSYGFSNRSHDKLRHCLKRVQTKGLRGRYNRIFNNADQPIKLFPQGIGVLMDISHTRLNRWRYIVREVMFTFDPAHIAEVKEALETGHAKIVSSGKSLYILA